MLALTSLPDWLVTHYRHLIFASLILSWLAALLGTRKAWQKIKNEVKGAKLPPYLAMLILWVLPILATLIAVAADRAAKTTEKEIAVLKKEAGQLRLDLAKQVSTGVPRGEKFNRDEFRKAVRNTAKIRVEFLYPPNDVESYLFAEAAAGCLKAEGWTVIAPKPLTKGDVNPFVEDKNAPLSWRAGTTPGGFSYITKGDRELSSDDPVQVVLKALVSAKILEGGGEVSAPWVGRNDPTLPDDLVRILIGPKYGGW